MPQYFRYAEDFTGLNPDNLVSGEIATLTDRPVRVCVPKHGPFFVESLRVYDNVTSRPLDKGNEADFVIPLISQELVLKTGKEVADCFLILNRDVSSTIRLSYQSIGDLYQNNVSNIVQIYESFLADNRSVDWETGVYGKPAAYPAALHGHMLEDLYHFEPLTFQMERLVQAIMLGNTPAWESLVRSLESQQATISDMENGMAVDKNVTLRGLLHVLDKYNFNNIRITSDKTRISNGGSFKISVEASWVPDDVRYYWTIEHGETDAQDFSLNSGYVNLIGRKAEFTIQALRDREAEVEESFRVALRRNSPTGQIVATSQRLFMKAHGEEEDTFYAAMIACCWKKPTLAKNPRMLHITRSFKNATYS